MSPASLFRAALLVALAAVAAFAVFPMFAGGADTGVAGDRVVLAETEAAGGRVVLVNETFKCSNYPQPLNLDLVKVTITAGQGVRRDAVHTSGSGSECTGRIGRLEIDTWGADGLKVHNQAHDLVIEGGYLRCHAVEGDVHQDGIQAMGGTRVTFKNFLVDCTTATNSAMFINQGAGRNGRPTDIVCDGCTLMKGPTRNRVLRISDSLRSGARNSTIVWCGTGPECGQGPPIYIIDAATDPVNENNRIVRHSDGPAPPAPPPGPPPPEEPGPAFRLTSFALSTATPSAGGRLNAVLGVSGIPAASAGKSVVTCRAVVRGKAVKATASGSANFKARCAFAVPNGSKGQLLTGLVGVTNRGSTVNRSFTLRIATRPQGGPAGRATGVFAPAPSGVSVRQFVLSSQRPGSGKRVFATIALAGLDASKGSLTCAGIAGGRSLRVLSKALKVPTATCGWLVPPRVGGRPVRFSITVATERARFVHSFHLTARS